MTKSCLTWNVNGIRACLKKGLLDVMKDLKPTHFCLQEIKISEEDLKPLLPQFLELGYSMNWSIADKKGYSGVLTGTLEPILSHKTGMPSMEADPEGRVVSFEFEHFWLINAYFPNAQRELKRIEYKLHFNQLMSEYCKKFDKPIILTGDLNVAHKAIDLANPKQNEKNAGFSKPERQWLDQFLELGFIDAFRLFDTSEGQYTWWTYRLNARQRNIGWRLDYFLISNKLQQKVLNCNILKHIHGSDHCPVLLEFSL